ncbi:MAG: WbqC family protein [Bacteroidota bacterium]
MQKALLHSVYFGPIDLFAKLIQFDKLILEKADNYQKQTYRTRQYIYGANGCLLLNIPIKHNKSDQKVRQKYADVRIENDFNWQTLHWKSLESAYRTSPFFEFYEDDIQPLYQKEYKSLFEFNLDCFQLILDLLGIEKKIEFTSVFEKTPTEAEITDLRSLSIAKRSSSLEIQTYIQVFQDKKGFLPNLSILDLLFNQGPSSLAYLEELNVKL